MSQKITSKNLTYDNALPPFLARLRGQQTAHSGPDPILAAQRRPGQKRSASEEAEDAPVVVDEDGNVVYLKDGVLEEEDGSTQKEENDKEEPGSDNKDEDGSLAQGKETEKVAGIGAPRKRKAGRIIGEEQSDEEREKTKTKSKKDDDKARITKASADVRRLISRDEDEDNTTDAHKSTDAADDKARKPQQQDRPPQQQKTIKSAKKKAAKKIKLSFGDDDGE
ncbi:hypothetical protein CHU98_g2931 [Xylaria longipes]|nr:hypothetical protein CHU98_g2931 [Xylaria longipes]